MMKWLPGLVLGILAVYAASGRGLPLIGNGRAAFWLLAVSGFAAHAAICTSNVIPSRALVSVGVVLGLLALLLIGAFATGLRPAWIATDQRAVIALAAIIAVKAAIATGSAAVTAMTAR